MKNGAFMSECRANINPTNNGLIAAPVVRATPIIPAAADGAGALVWSSAVDHYRSALRDSGKVLFELVQRKRLAVA